MRRPKSNGTHRPEEAAHSGSFVAPSYFITAVAGCTTVRFIPPWVLSRRSSDRHGVTYSSTAAAIVHNITYKHWLRRHNNERRRPDMFFCRPPDRPGSVSGSYRQGRLVRVSRYFFGSSACFVDRTGCRCLGRLSIVRSVDHRPADGDQMLPSKPRPFRRHMRYRAAVDRCMCPFHFSRL